MTNLEFIDEQLRIIRADMETGNQPAWIGVYLEHEWEIERELLLKEIIS